MQARSLTGLGDLASLAKSQHRSTPDMIAEVLRGAILRGILQGGTPLRQDRIASDFGVSRIPVREALRRLVAEGLAELRPHHGAIVSELSPRAVEEIYEMSSVLEGKALELAIPRLSEKDLDGATKIFGELDQAIDVHRWSELNREFHLSLYTPADRPRLLTLINNLRDHTDRYTRIYISLMQRKSSSQREHRRILEACRARNIAEGASALADHLRIAQDDLIAYLRRERGSSEPRDTGEGDVERR